MPHYGMIEPHPTSCRNRGPLSVLPVLEREPLFYVEDEETSDGYPLTAVYGEQGPQIAGWLDRSEPRWVEGLHLLEAIVRWPWALAILLEVAGPGAEEQVGKIRARRQRM